jgi:hypothetical protein
VVVSRTQNKCLGFFETFELEDFTVITPNFTVHCLLIEIRVALFDHTALLYFYNHTCEVRVFDFAIMKVEIDHAESEWAGSSQTASVFVIVSHAVNALVDRTFKAKNLAKLGFILNNPDMLEPGTFQAKGLTAVASA